MMHLPPQALALICAAALDFRVSRLSAVQRCERFKVTQSKHRLSEESAYSRPRASEPESAPLPCPIERHQRASAVFSVMHLGDLMQGWSLGSGSITSSCTPLVCRENVTSRGSFIPACDAPCCGSRPRWVVQPRLADALLRRVR
jgi:hypothetical protein